MKNLVFIFTCVLGFALMSEAYQTKGATRPNFSSSPSVEQEAPATTPEQPGVQTRTFSNYGSRVGVWRRGGVKARAVKPSKVKEEETKEVKEQEKEFAPIPQVSAEQPVSKPEATKKSAFAPVVRDFTKKSSAVKKEEEPKPAAQPADPAQPGNSAAAMEQLQGLQKMMSGLGGNVPGGAAGGGMPDLSALMNAAGGGAATQQPKK